MVLESPDSVPLLRQPLLNQPIPLQRRRFVVTIPIDRIRIKVCRRLHHRFDRLSHTPRKGESVLRQRAAQLFQAPQHETDTGRAEHLRAQQRLVEDKERHNLPTFLARRRQGGIVAKPKIATKPDQPFHEGTSGEEEASRCAGGTGSANRIRRQAT